jgi:GDPmannose 4,6-dehydratase|tara:strand:+ start:1258 stop:2256 length:999 start_codon:yes stop_codon:yes gene_type:complete
MGKLKKKKKAIITGITGQDGSYLAELLLKKNYEVHGIVRRVALEDETHRLWRIRKILKKIKIHSASLESYASLVKIVEKVKPNEIYHLAAQSYVSYSFEDEFSTLNTNINGTHYMLSAIKDFSPKTKFYFAASSEMFGKVKKTPQNEQTPFHPRSAYGISKVAGFELTRNYREAYNLFACSGILFNHESPRRGFEFVTRKISHSVARIKLGLQKDLKLGNINSMRDWGHASDYVDAMWMMLQQKKASDFVIGTGKMHSVKDFAKLAFTHVGLDYKKYIKINKNLLRPSEVDKLCADYKYAQKVLNWKPDVNFNKLVKQMVDEDIKFVKKSGH